MPDIHHKFHVNASPHQVFETFTRSEGLNSWWTLQSSGEPLKGNVYNFYFGPAYDWLAAVIHVIPDQELTWRMTRAMDDWMETEVGFRLTLEGSGTAIWFFHTGWKELSDHYSISNFCWGQLLNGMKNYLEKGTVIPFPERN